VRIDSNEAYLHANEDPQQRQKLQGERFRKWIPAQSRCQLEAASMSGCCNAVLNCFGHIYDHGGMDLPMISLIRLTLIQPVIKAGQELKALTTMSPFLSDNRVRL
jgi:hypothetical protein